MELPVQPSSQVSRGRNLERAPWRYLLWGAPVVIVIGAGAAYGASVLSLTARGALWVIAVAWAGIGCLNNGRSCGRVHCRIDGILFPLLSIIGALNVLSIHFIRLESILACFHHNSDWKLRSWMDLKEVLVVSDMAGADDARNYPG